MRTPAAFPLALAACGDRVVRLRFGERDRGSPSSYLAGRPAPSAKLSAALVRPLDDLSGLELRGPAGEPRLRLSLDGVALSPQVRLRLEVVGEQHFYGLGQGGQPFDRLGATRRLWNCHVNHGPGADIAIPLLLSSKGYGLFFDTASRARLDPGDSGDETWLEFIAEDTSLDLYYIAGDDLRSTLSEVATMLGRAPMPPRWALGYLQSTRHLESPAELLDLAAFFRERRLPCDALILLSTYGDARGWNPGVGHLAWEPELFPEPASAVAALHEQGFRVVTHEYPVLHPDSPLGPEARERAFLLESGYPNVDPAARPLTGYHEGQRHLDFSRPEVGAWWWEQHRGLLRDGIDGWWLDGGEGPPSADLHNRYDLLRQEVFAEAEARDRPERRAFLLCRSGGPGMQRFGAACWSGDINGTFPALEAQIAVGLNVGLSGVPYWGTDIGGYYATGLRSGELFARWFQFGAFCPVFRAHGRPWRDRLPWAYGPEIEAVCRRYLELRYRLMPYTYSLAWQAHRLGLPLMRPLALNYPDDPRTWDLGSQYLWGDDLLVAPVTREGVSHWPAYLPGGTWYDFWTHEAYQGSDGITVPAPLDRLPLFVRSGAILPTGPLRQHEDGQAPTDLSLLVYPDGRSAFTLYEDDGSTGAYRRGGFALTEIGSEASDEGIVCRVAAPRGDGAGLVPEGRTYSFRIRVPAAPRSVEVEGVAQPAWSHDGRHFLRVDVTRHPVEVRIRR